MPSPCHSIHSYAPTPSHYGLPQLFRQLLLGAGADASVCDGAGRSPLDAALEASAADDSDILAALRKDWTAARAAGSQEQDEEDDWAALRSSAKLPPA